jgi:hypothetical protein
MLDSKDFKDLVAKKGTIHSGEGLDAHGMYVNAAGDTIKLCTFNSAEMDYLQKAHYIREDSRGIYRLTSNAYAIFDT